LNVALEGVLSLHLLRNVEPTEEFAVVLADEVTLIKKRNVSATDIKKREEQVKTKTKLESDYKRLVESIRSGNEATKVTKYLLKLPTTRQPRSQNQPRRTPRR